MGRIRIMLVRAGSTVAHFPNIAPPLGIMSLSAYLQQRPRREVRLLDQRIEAIDAAATARAVLRFAPEILGISSMTCDIAQAYDIARAYRRGGGQGLVLLGGPHSLVGAEQALEDRGIDAVVMGEGEQTLEAIVQRVEAGDPWKEVRGIAYREDDEIQRTAARPYIEDLDGLPLPDPGDLPLERYYRRLNMTALGRQPYAAIFTSRSCPYRCIYCHNVFGQGFRAMSPARVLAEIDHNVKTHGLRTFEIIDDCFNLDRDRARLILEGIARRDDKLHLSLPNGIRGDIVPDDMFPLFVAAGVNYIAWAVESASPRIQKLTRKHLNLERLERAITLGAKHSIWGNGFFMLGFPTETREELHQTLDFAMRSKLNTASFFLVNPFEGTELYSLYADQLGERPQGEYFDYQVAPFNLTEVSDDELYAIKREANRRFYLSPSRLLRILREHPSKLDLLSYFVLFLRRAV